MTNNKQCTQNVSFQNNRVCHAFVELEDIARRFQKVKKVYTNEVVTLNAMREMITNILADIEENTKEVGNP